MCHIFQFFVKMASCTKWDHSPLSRNDVPIGLGFNCYCDPLKDHTLVVASHWLEPGEEVTFEIDSPMLETFRGFSIRFAA